MVIERQRAESLLELAAQKVAAEAKRFEGIRQRKQMRPAWLEDALRAAGVLQKGGRAMTPSAETRRVVVVTAAAHNVLEVLAKAKSAAG